MNKTVYGYVRVSSRDQHVDRQVLALLEFGIPQNHIFTDKISGKNFERPRYQALIERIEPGDTLVVKSIDRLGRNYEEILEQWRRLTKTLMADIVVLDMPLLDTRQGKDLTGTLIADIVLQLLSYVAQTERDFIRQRQAEGIAAAKARGVRFGRAPLALPSSYSEVYRAWQSGSLSARKASKRLGVSHQTFLKWARDGLPAGSTVREESI